MAKIITKRGRPRSAECGTISGYESHKYYRETACKKCITANKVYRKQWRLNNSAKIKKHNRIFYHKNPQYHQEYAKEWRKTNSEKYKQAQLKYRLSNYEKVKENGRKASHKRRALKFGSGYSPYTEQQVLEKYGTNCHLCKLPIDMNAPRKVGKNGWQKGLHIEHLIPLSKNGKDNLKNVRPSHGLCNMTKYNKIVKRKGK